MKLRYTYLFFVVVCLWVLLKSNSAGRATTANPMQTCAGTGCHNTAPGGITTTIDSVAIFDKTTNLPVTQYMPGTAYRVAIIGRTQSFSTNPNTPKFGFIVDNNSKGSFSGTTSKSTTASSGRYWGHNQGIDSILSLPIGIGRVYSFMDTCTWTAPSAGSGTVVFNARLNGVNNNGMATGDAPTPNTPIYAKNLIEFTNVASVSISMIGAPGAFCAGVSKTFLATATNPGTTPTYQWYKNNVMVGTGGLSYTDAGLANNDSIWVVMNSSISGITNNPATSNKIKVTVNPAFNNNVTIVGNKTSGCAGDTVVFTATPSAGTTSPQYRWYRNNTQIKGPGYFPDPTNSATLTVIGLTAGDSFSCRLQAGNLCSTPVNDTSNYLKITVTPSPVITGHINDTICVGDSSKATNWMSNIAGTTYTWTNSNPAIGLPASGTGQIPKFKTPDDIGMGQISGIITVRSFGGGCSGSPVTYTVFVRRRPNISVSGHQRSYCEGAIANITVSSTGFGNSISWTNDNTAIGLPASGSNGFINFTATNTTTDSLVANIKASVFNTTSRCTKDTNIKIVVYPKPSVNNISNIFVCEGKMTSNIDFTSSVPGVNYTWINSNTAIGLAASGSGNIPAFTATNTSGSSIMGTITVSPSYKSCLGSNKTFNITVEKNSVPTVNIATATTNLCEGSSALFTATPSNGGTAPVYEWKRNGIVISGAIMDTVTVMNVQNNDKIQCKIISNSPCVTVDTALSNEYTISTITNLVPTITLSTLSDTVCTGNVLVINTTITHGGSAPTYAWYLNGNPIFGANSDLYFSNSFAMNDEIYCELTSNLGCANPKKATSNIKKIKVFDPTPTSISISKNKNKICSDELVTFTTNFTGGGLNPSVNWKLNGEQMNTNKKFITVPISGTFDIVELKVKSSLPCPSPPYPTLYISVDTVMQGPVVSVSPSPYTAFCEGDSAEVKILGVQPTHTYSWSNGKNDTSFYSKVSNTYTLTVTEAGNICPRTYGPITTIANPLPIKPFIYMYKGQLISTAADRYQWQLAKQDIVGADSMKYTPIVSGMYRVKITNNAGCVNYSDELNPANSGIAASNLSNPIKIYPNPSTGIFSISSDNSRIDEIKVTDLMGKTVFEVSVKDMHKEINLSEYPKGIYFIHVKYENNNVIQKLELK